MQEKLSLKDFAKQYPEYCEKPKKKRISNDKIKFLCQCKSGHIFDYRERIKFPQNDKHYAPCQGRCPNCGITNFSFITGMYPIKMNFLG